MKGGQSSMMTLSSSLLLLLLWYLHEESMAFIIPSIRKQIKISSTSSFLITPHHHHHHHHTSFSSFSSIVLHETQLPKEVESLDEERRSNLFQSLLRDLQIEGVPLLGCDVEQVHTLNAALWTTMAEMSEKNEEQKVCLIMEKIPLNALLAFVQDFTVLKTQKRLMTYLPELNRVSLSLVGKGVGPGLIIDFTERTEEEKMEVESRRVIESKFDEMKCTTALQSFVERVVVGFDACPYTQSPTIAATGLSHRGVTEGPVAYRYSSSSDAMSAMASFWNSVCELLSTSQEQVSTALLSLPAIGYVRTDDDDDDDVEDEAHARFAAVVELMGRYLCLFRGDSVFGLVHFHPLYNRNKIHPVDKPSYGHLPPISWLRPMLRLNKNNEEAESLTDDQLFLSNYQRRSPHTMINILRVSQLNAASGPNSIVDLELDNGLVEKASGIVTYTRNAIRLASIGKETLDRDLNKDQAMEF